MAGVFEDVHLEWDGTTYTIPSNRMMGAINCIEQHVTLSELSEAANRRGTVKLGVLAAAYGSVLRYAGAKVVDEDVYAGMFEGAAPKAVIAAAVEALMMMMIPPQAMAAAAKLGAASGDGGAVTPGKPNRRARRAAASSSRKRSN